MLYPLTENLQQELDRYRSNGLYKSCLEVMGCENLDGEDPDIIGMRHINSKLEGYPIAKYLYESTISRGGNVEKDAEGDLRIGIGSQGTRIKLDTPVDWRKYDNETRNLRYKVQSMLVTDSLLRADSDKRNKRWYKPCLRYFRDWVSTFIVKGETDDFLWYDMAVGQRASKLSYIIRRAIEEKENYNYIAPMIVAADIHIKELMNAEKLALHSNHGLFQMAGLLALGKLLPFMNKSQDAIIFAKEKIMLMLEGHFTPEGLHKEHSPIYHMYMTNYIQSILKSELLNDEVDFQILSDKAVSNASWMIMPDENILPFGDSAPEYILRRADFPVNIENGRPTPPSGFKNFANGGLVISSHHDDFGNPSEYFAFNASFFSRQHKHSDDMGFQFYHKGKSLMSDAGTFTYQYDQLERIFVESTRAHNCLEIDNHDYSRFRADAFGSCVNYAVEVESCLFIEANVSRRRLIPSELPYNKVKNEDCEVCNIEQRRLIFYLPDRFLIILDEVLSDKERSYTQWFNLSPKMRADFSGDEVVISDSNEVICILRDVSLQPVELEKVRGETYPRMQGWTSLNGNTLTPIDAVGKTTSGKRAVIGSMIDLNFDKTENVALNIGTNGKYMRVVVRDNDEKFEMVTRKGDDQIKLEFIRGGKTYSTIVK